MHSRSPFLESPEKCLVSFWFEKPSVKLPTASNVQQNMLLSIKTCNKQSNNTCNCRQKNTCPLNGNCLQSSVVYQATVTQNDNNTPETYIRLTETDSRTRHRIHTASFRHAKHKNSTELSKHIWTLKNDNIDYSISWCVLSSSSPYDSSSKRCNLCLKEKIPDKLPTWSLITISVTNSYLHAYTETKRCYATAEL